MPEADFLRNEAERMVRDAADPASLRQAAELLQLAAQIESLNADRLKTEAERRQILQSVDAAKQTSRSEQLRYFVSQLSPIITVVVLAGTLFLQTVQLRDSDRQKEIDRENASWSDALRATTGSDKHFAWSSIQGYLQSPSHGAQAKEISAQLVQQGTDLGLFNTIDATAFDPVTWQNLQQVLEIDRTLGKENNDFSNRALRGATLSSQENARKSYTDKVVTTISEQLAVFLRSPQAKAVDLSNAFVWSADFANADFGNANLTGFYADQIDVTGADLRAAQTSNSYWKRVAWWRAARVNREFLRYLVQNDSFDPRADYGLSVKPTNAQFVASVKRLEQGSADNAVKQPK